MSGLSGIWAAAASQNILEVARAAVEEESQKRKSTLEQISEVGPENFAKNLRNEGNNNPIDSILEIVYFDQEYYPFCPARQKEVMRKVGVLATTEKPELWNMINAGKFKEKRKGFFYEDPLIGVLVLQSVGEKEIREIYRYYEGWRFLPSGLTRGSNDNDCGSIGDTKYFKGYKGFTFEKESGILIASQGYNPHPAGRMLRIESQFEKQLIHDMQKNWETVIKSS